VFISTLDASQVVRELRKTAYAPSMAILASRKHYCINKAVVRSGRIDEMCEELNRSDYGCRYHRGPGKGKERGGPAAAGLIQLPHPVR
jgi:fanconi anemia group J protein